MKNQDPNPRRLVRLALDIWLHRFTAPGRFLLIATFVASSWGSIALTIPIYHLSCGLAGLMGVSLLWGFATWRRLRIRGELPEKVSAGLPFTAEFVVENDSRFSVFDLGLGFFYLPDSLRHADERPTVPRLAPGESARLSVRIEPLRRGVYDLPRLSAWSVFPFNLWRKTVSTRRVGSLTVLPSFHSLPGIELPPGRRYQPGGVALTSNVGESPEYIGNREYRPGDPPRHIDHRSWARLSTPAVKEFQEEYYCRIALILDTYVPKRRRPRPEGFPDLEAAVSLTAAIADCLSRGEYLIDIFAAGPELYVFRAGRHLAHFDNILEILACVDACREGPFDKLSPVLSEELRNITAAVYVLLDWDRPRERFVRMGAESGSSVRVFVVRDKATSEPYGHAEDWTGPIVPLTPGDVLRGEARFR